MPTFSRNALREARSGPGPGSSSPLVGERAIDPDRAALNGLERSEAAQQGALSGAARSDDDENLARAQLEIDVVENGGGSVTLDQLLHDNEGSAVHSA